MKITTRGRIEAAVAANSLTHELFDEKSNAPMGALANCYSIIFHTKQAKVNVGNIRDCITELLRCEVTSAFDRLAQIRLRCAEIERALGIRHSAETQAALDAESSERSAAGFGAWDTYCNQFRPKAEAA